MIKSRSKTLLAYLSILVVACLVAYANEEAPDTLIWGGDNIVTESDQPGDDEIVLYFNSNDNRYYEDQDFNVASPWCWDTVNQQVFNCGLP